AGVDDHISSPESTRCSIRKYDFDRSWTDKATGAENEFRSALPIIFQIDVIPVRHHSAFALTYGAHVDSEISLRYPKLFTSPEMGSALCTMDDVLARQTGDVRTRATDIFALDDRNTLSFAGKSPRGDCSTRATAKDQQVIFVNLTVLP